MQNALGARARQLATRPFAVMVIECWTTHKMQSVAINMFALVLSPDVSERGDRARRTEGGCWRFRFLHLTVANMFDIFY